MQLFPYSQSLNENHKRIKPVRSVQKYHFLFKAESNQSTKMANVINIQEVRGILLKKYAIHHYNLILDYLSFISQRWCCKICNIFGEGGENLFEHAMDYHHTDTHQAHHRCFCLASFDGMYDFYHHFRVVHAKIAYICLRCLRTYENWVVARDHYHSCRTTLTNGH